jgi:hypothetical protein
MMENLEKVYDEQISPLMKQIIDICKENKMPMFAEFQYGDTDFCKTRLCGEDWPGHFLFNHLEVLTQCMQEGGINIDKYMFWVMRHAKKQGHSSMILSQLDIPTEPVESQEAR